MATDLDASRRPSPSIWGWLFWIGILSGVGLAAVQYGEALVDLGVFK